MVRITNIGRIWRRIPRSFKRQFIAVVLLSILGITILVLMYPRPKEAFLGPSEPATMLAEVYQYTNNPLDAELEFYRVGNRTNMLYHGWSWEQIPVTSGYYDIVINHYQYKQEYYNIKVNSGENRMRFNLAAGLLIIDTSFADAPTVVQMEVYQSQDRMNPIVFCQSNQRLILPPGEYDVRFVWEGNEEWLEGLTINDGQVVAKSYQLKRHAL